MKCRECRDGELETRIGEHVYVESGLPNVVLENVELRHCPKCGANTVAIPRIEALHRAIARALAHQTARLEGVEVRFLRKYLGLSGRDFAKVMAVTPETVSRWEHNHEPVSGIADHLLRMLVAHAKPIDEYPLERLAEVSQEGVKRGRLAMVAGSKDWRTEERVA